MSFGEAVKLLGQRWKPILKMPPEQKHTIANALFNIVKEHGPITVANTWLRAKLFVVVAGHCRPLVETHPFLCRIASIHVPSWPQSWLSKPIYSCSCWEAGKVLLTSCLWSLSLNSSHPTARDSAVAFFGSIAPLSGIDHLGLPSLEEVGLKDLTSKNQMKVVLRWMREKQKLRLLCNRVGAHKQFQYTIPATAGTVPSKPKPT
ncbi:hypothetical protein RIF29_14391 [Crotalaria pallida]|uniref:Uncharacterized protein n=1 Tax=Crotalaria pallida TaxID=3830 RepID=A0AAN9FB80_CROPI